MPRIERYTTDEPIPVKREQIIDPSKFPFSTAGAEAFQTIGGVVEELARRKMAADDSLAINAAEESRDIARLKMQQYMYDNPDPSTWDEGLRKIIEEQQRHYSRQKFSPRAKAMEDIDQQAFIDELFTSVQIASTVRTVDNDITTSGKNLINKITHDDGTPTSAADIDKQMKLYQAALERKYEKKVAAIQMEETLKEARKAYYIYQSKLFPDDIIARMQKKKNALKKGERDNDGLEAKDYEDIISSAYMAKSLAGRENDKQQEMDRDRLGRALYDGTITYEMINSTSLDEKEQESYRLKMNAEAERLAKGEIIKVNQDVQSQLEMEATGIWTGAVSKEDILKKAREARFPSEGRPKIDDAGFARINTIATTAYKSYQTGALQDGAQEALKQLVTYDTPDSLEQMAMSIHRQYSGEEAKAQIERVITDRQLQFQNYSWYKRAMRDYIKDHSEADADEILKHSDSLIREYRKRTSDDIRTLIGQEKEPSKEVIDETLALKTKGAFIPDDTRLYVEPPPLQGKIKNWMSLSEDERKSYWEKYEKGELITSPKPEAPEQGNKKETEAYNQIFDIWELLPKSVQDAVKLRRQMKEPYTKILTYDEISAAISARTKK